MVQSPVTSRREFQDLLGRALADMKALVLGTPDFAPYREIETQLEAIRRWTANGREPSKEERETITIGLILIREFDPEPDVTMYEVMQRLRAVAHYFRKWPHEGLPPY